MHRDVLWFIYIYIRIATTAFLNLNIPYHTSLSTGGGEKNGFSITRLTCRPANICRRLVDGVFDYWTTTGFLAKIRMFVIIRRFDLVLVCYVSFCCSSVISFENLNWGAPASGADFEDLKLSILHCASYAERRRYRWETCEAINEKSSNKKKRRNLFQTCRQSGLAFFVARR